jgi:hypothetical protein
MVTGADTSHRTFSSSTVTTFRRFLNPFIYSALPPWRTTRAWCFCGTPNCLIRPNLSTSGCSLSRATRSSPHQYPTPSSMLVLKLEFSQTKLLQMHGSEMRIFTMTGSRSSGG